MTSHSEEQSPGSVGTSAATEPSGVSNGGMVTPVDGAETTRSSESILAGDLVSIVPCSVEQRGCITHKLLK